jgi:hypothetical protein
MAMRPNQAAALQLWRQVLAACRTAGNGDLDTDRMGYIALEIALGLMALDFTKQQLVTHFKNVVAEIEADEWRVVNAGLGLENTAGEDWSWIEQLSGLKGAHQDLARRQLSQLQELACYSPRLRQLCTPGLL